MAPSAPVSRLPVEILDIIFNMVQNSPRDLPAANGDQRGPALLGYRLVCKRWNDVIISIPRLWSTIRVSDFPCGDERALTIGAGRSLRWSRPLPVGLEFDGCTTFPDSALNQSWERIASIKIKNSAYYAAFDFFHHVLGSFTLPNLRKLMIETDIRTRCKAFHEGFVDYHPLLSLPVLQQLELLEIRGLCINCSSISHWADIRVTLPSLTQLNLDPISANRTDLREIFNVAPNLETLALGIDYMRPGSTPRTTSGRGGPIKAPDSLHSLALQFRVSHDSLCGCAISEIQAPGLQYFEIGGLFPSPWMHPHGRRVLKAITAPASLERVRIHINDEPSHAHWPSALGSVLSHPVDVEFVSTTLTSPIVTGFVPEIFYRKNIRTLTFNVSRPFVDCIVAELRAKPLPQTLDDGKHCIAPVVFRIFGDDTPSSLQTEELRAAVAPFLRHSLAVYWARNDAFQSDGGLLSRQQVIPVPGVDIAMSRRGEWAEFCDDSDSDSNASELEAFINEHCM